MSVAESVLGRDLSHVRVHPNSGEPQALGAVAFARWQDVHFAPGRFQPETPSGLRLLGHELAHVAQQARGDVRATAQVNGVPVNDDPALERAADAAGNRIARGVELHAATEPHSGRDPSEPAGAR